MWDSRFFICLLISVLVLNCSVNRSSDWECGLDEDCPAGEYCYDGKCIPLGEADSGSDADSGTDGATEPDTGSDASIDGGQDINECLEGESVCTDNSNYKNCIQSGDNWIWSEARACASHQTCAQGTCQCDNQCGLGSFECAGTTDYQKCALDANQCLAFNVLPCGTNFGCESSLNLCVSDVFKLNQYTLADINFPVFFRINNQRYGILWPGTRRNGTEDDIFGRIFNSQGVALFSEFIVNTCTTDLQYMPSVGLLGADRFVVVWNSKLNDENTNIYGRVFTSNGDPLFSEFLVNSLTTNENIFPKVVVADDQQFFVTWIQLFSGQYRLRGKKFNRQGEAILSEFYLDAENNTIPSFFDVKKLAPDRFFIAWGHVTDSGPLEYRMYGQMFNGQGGLLSPDPIQITTSTSLYQVVPQIELLDNNKLAVVWLVSVPLTSDWKGIFGQIIKSDGAFISSVFQVNTNTAGFPGFPQHDGFITYRQIRRISDDRFAVVWESRDQAGQPGHYDVYGRIFYDTGNPVTSEIHINTYAINSQRWPQLAAIDPARFMVVWHYLANTSPDPNDGGIYGTLFDSRGNKLSSEFMINTGNPAAQLYPIIDQVTTTGSFGGNRLIVIWKYDKFMSYDDRIVFSRIYYFE